MKAIIALVSVSARLLILAAGAGYAHADIAATTICAAPQGVEVSQADCAHWTTQAISLITGAELDCDRLDVVWKDDQSAAAYVICAMRDAAPKMYGWNGRYLQAINGGDAEWRDFLKFVRSK